MTTTARTESTEYDCASLTQKNTAVDIPEVEELLVVRVEENIDGSSCRGKKLSSLDSSVG